MASDEKKQAKEIPKENGSKKISTIIIKAIIFLIAIYPLVPIFKQIYQEKTENKILWQELVRVYNEQKLYEPITNDLNEPEQVKEENIIKSNNFYRKFNQKEMDSYFAVDLIDTLEPENYLMKRALKNYDINEDEKIKEHPEEYRVNSILYGEYIEKDYSNDDRFYIQLIDQHKGFGLFANKKISQNEVIGVYTGLISMQLGKKIFDTKYLFHISSIKHPYTGAKADLYIDARAAGNQLRFVNHDSNPNCEAIYVPHNNMWNIIFVAKRDIPVNEEITISYGKSFKSVRGKEIEEKEEESGPDDYMDTEWDIKRKEEKEARDPNTGKLLHPHMPNMYELQDQKKRILQRMRSQGY